jgi:hypothetical protein
MASGVRRCGRVNLLHMLQCPGANWGAPGNLLSNMINYVPSSENSITNMGLPARQGHAFSMQ